MRTKRRSVLAVGVVVALAMLMSACGDEGGGEARGSDSAVGSADAPIVIGLLDEQTGPTASVQGKAGNGARAAVALINRTGGIDGRPVELVTRDTAGDANTTIRAISELADEGAVMIVGPVNGALCQSVPAGLKRARIPGICLSPADLPEDDEYLFGIGVELAQVDAAAFELLAEGDDAIGEGNGKVGILAQKTPLGELMEAHAADAADVAEFTVERIEPTATTAEPQLQRLIDAGVGGILLGPCGPLAVTAAREAIDLGYEGTIMLYNCFASDAGAQAVKDFTNGKVVTLASTFALRDVPQDDPQHEAYTRFANSEAENEVVTATGWDGMFLAKAAIEKAGSTDARKIIDVLESGFDFAGAWSLGRITADDHRGVDPTNALIPVVLTREGTMERIGS